MQSLSDSLQVTCLTKWLNLDDEPLWFSMMDKIRKMFSWYSQTHKLCGICLKNLKTLKVQLLSLAFLLKKYGKLFQRHEQVSHLKGICWSFFIAKNFTCNQFLWLDADQDNSFFPENVWTALVCSEHRPTQTSFLMPLTSRPITWAIFTSTKLVFLGELAKDCHSFWSFCLQTVLSEMAIQWKFEEMQSALSSFSWWSSSWFYVFLLPCELPFLGVVYSYLSPFAVFYTTEPSLSKTGKLLHSASAFPCALLVIFYQMFWPSEGKKEIVWL